VVAPHSGRSTAVQRELEITGEAHDAAIVLCDRGTIDGLAHGPAGGPNRLGSAAASVEVGGPND